MKEQDLNAAARAIDWLASIGERDLARKISFRVLLELKRSTPEEKPEAVREIEAELKKTYVEDLSSTGSLLPGIAGYGGVQKEMDDRPRSGYRSILIETSLKTAAVLVTFFLLFLVGAFILNLGDKHAKMISKIERGDDRKWNQLEAAISRNPYLYYRSALIYEGRGEIDKAIFQMEKALSLAPGSEQYRKKLDELLKMAQEGIDSEDERD